jgi:hypothetical protein
MDFQKYIDLQSENEALRSGHEYNLGDFIKDLEKLPKNKAVQIELGVYPFEFDSWRGSYRELSLDYSKTPITVSELLKEAKKAVGKTFEGYKGGDFTMSTHTPIHIAAYGSSRYTYRQKENECIKLIGIKELDDTCILVTRIDD